MAVRSRREVEPELLYPEERGEVVEPEFVEAEYELVNPVKCLPAPAGWRWQGAVTRQLVAAICGALMAEGGILLWAGVVCPGLTAFLCGAVVFGVVLREDLWKWPRQ